MPGADIAVIGGGPGGYATALRAAVRGQSVVLVEADRVGGTCLHRGCVPSKALLHVASVVDSIATAGRLGVDVGPPSLRVDDIRAFRTGVVETMHRGLASLLKQRGVRVITATGRLADDGHTVLAGDERVVAAHVVLATGSRPASLDVLPVDGTTVITSDEATQLPRIPRQAVVVGSGAVGLEFASLWRSLGAEVTLIETLPRIAPREDEDVSSALAAAFTRRGISVRAGARVRALARREGVATVRVEVDGAEVEIPADTVLVAIGRAPNLSGAGDIAVGLAGASGHLTTDDLGRVKGADHLFAVGDLLPPPAVALAHAAFAEGFAVADSIAGEPVAAVDHTRVPRVTYSSPEVGSVGLTEAQARATGIDPTVSVVALAGTARGRIEAGDGFVKVVAGERGDILGVHIVGPHATELIAEAQLITSWEARAGDVARIVHPHPTISEAVGEAHLALAGLPFHTGAAH